MKILLFLTISLFFFLPKIFSQNILIVEKINRPVHNHRYKQGSMLYIKLENGNVIYDVLKEVKDSSIIINKQEIKLKEICKVYHRRKGIPLLRAISTMCLFAFVPANIITNATNNRQWIDENTLQLAGIFGATALTTHILSTSKIKLNKHWKLRTVVF